MKPLSKNIIFAIIAILILSAIFSSYTLSAEKPEDVSMAALVEEIENGVIESISIEGVEVTAVLKDGSEQKTRKESAVSLSEVLIDYGITSEQLREADITVNDRSTRSYVMGVILPSLLPLLLLVFIDRKSVV